jgi:hypothetical protein
MRSAAQATVQQQIFAEYSDALGLSRDVIGTPDGVPYRQRIARADRRCRPQSGYLYKTGPPGR